MSFATKLNHVVYADGSAHDVMKHPLTDMGKISLPGETLGNNQRCAASCHKQQQPELQQVVVCLSDSSQCRSERPAVPKETGNSSASLTRVVDGRCQTQSHPC
jgi:hypothetical protein